MAKIDYKAKLKHLYKASAKKIEFVEVPQMNFLSVDGTGNPNTAQAYKDAVEALFSLSYAIKFMIKKGATAIDYGVMPLEGLWWTEDMSKFSVDNKDDWQWTLMIMQPEMVTREWVDESIEQTRKKKNLPALPIVRFESFAEGKAAQVLHVGPFAEEGPTIQKLHGFIEEHGHLLTGKHHEIYLSDIRKAAPEKWKTIIRQPMTSMT